MNNDAAKIVITAADVVKPRVAGIRIDPENILPPPASAPESRSASRARGLLIVWRRPVAFVAAMAVLIAGVVFLQPPASTDWIESVAANAARSVVQLRSKEAMGTGTVIAANGRRMLILTNKHVLEMPHDKNAAYTSETIRCEVLLRSGERASGQLAGWAKDDNVDLALVVVSTFHPPPALRIVGFSSIRIGKHVIAIGHPLGLDFTITDGIISAKRDGRWLQTTAPINHGSSGGPIVDQSGHLLGINTMFVDEGHGPAYGFALRADYVTFRDAWHYSYDIADLLGQVQATHHEAP